MPMPSQFLILRPFKLYSGLSTLSKMKCRACQLSITFRWWCESSMISKLFIRVNGIARQDPRQWGSIKKILLNFIKGCILYNVYVWAVWVCLMYCYGTLLVEWDKISSESSHSWIWMLQLFFSPSLKSLIDGCKNDRRNPQLKSSINLSNKSGSRLFQWIQVTSVLLLVVLSSHKLLISSIKLFNICNNLIVYNIWRVLLSQD